MNDEHAHPAYQMRIVIPARRDGMDLVAEIAKRICELEKEHGVPGQPLTWELGAPDERVYEADEPQADFSYRIQGDVVAVWDHDRGGRSVTNDAEAVIAEMVREGVSLDGKRVLYWDSNGAWDELRVENGRFAGFNILNALTLDLARAMLAKGHGPEPE